MTTLRRYLRIADAILHNLAWAGLGVYVIDRYLTYRTMIVTAESAPQQAAGAGMLLVEVIVPYIVVRAFTSLRGRLPPAAAARVRKTTRIPA